MGQNSVNHWKRTYFAGTTLGICLLGASPALASPGCNTANAGGFNLTTPASTNLLTQLNGTFDAGDTLFATATGMPLGVGVDILPGPLPLLVVNNANGMGSHIFASTGPITLDIVLAGGGSGPAFLSFTCTAASAPLSGGTSDAAVQSDTATNSTTTQIIIENGTITNIIEGVTQESPQPDAAEILAQFKSDNLWTEYKTLTDQRTALETDIAHFEEDPESVKAATPDNPGIMTSGVLRATTELGDGFRTISSDQSEWIDQARAELAAIIKRQSEIGQELKGLPAPALAPAGNISSDGTFIPENETRYDDPEEMGDGERLFFAGRDPFARALMRYRGFRLDVADTGEGFSDSVKPLSFTRTLSSTMVGWVRAVYTDYEQDDASQQEGDNILVALGIHKDFNDDLRVGLFATSTWGNVSSPVNNLDIDTTGYSLGAYGRYKWGEIDVNASTRIGLTDNDIAVSGTTGSYDTRLASATLGISGEEQLSDDVWMRPAISVTGTWVNREDYVNSAGTAIGGNTTWSGNVTAGPTIGTSLTPPEGLRRLEPAIGLQAVYTFSDQDTQSGTVTASEDDYLSLAVSPQLSLEFNNGASLDVFGSYFGIGADLDGWSVGGTLSIPLN